MRGTEGEESATRESRFWILKRNKRPYGPEILESQHFILGPKVEECEAAAARYSGCEFAIGVSSGSDALLACLMANNIGPGQKAISKGPFTNSERAPAETLALPIYPEVPLDQQKYVVGCIQEFVAPSLGSEARIAGMPAHSS